MDFIDYMEKLQISFDDSNKQEIFKSRLQTFLQSHPEIPFSADQEAEFCYQVGAKNKLVQDGLFGLSFDNPDLTGLQRVWLYLREISDFRKFLACTVTFANTYKGLKKNKQAIFDAITRTLRDSHIQYDTLHDGDGIYFFQRVQKNLMMHLFQRHLNG